MMKARIFHALVSLTLLSSFLVSACGPEDSDATPTLSPEIMQTLAVVTFSVGLTQTEAAKPTNTPTITPSPTSSPTLAVTNTPGKPSAPSAGGLPVSTCNSLAFISDVTIPDNTSMKPGQKFTKTWRVKNNGTCAWDTGFKFNSVGGNALGGTSLTLTETVSPGSEIDLSVSMTAPSTAGSHQSNWKMSNAAGAFFGDEVYVIIVVSGSGSTTNTPVTSGSSVNPTATATATEVATDPPPTEPPPAP